MTGGTISSHKPTADGLSAFSKTDQPKRIIIQAHRRWHSAAAVSAGATPKGGKKAIVIGPADGELIYPPNS
jgi:hypothetical protein